MEKLIFTLLILFAIQTQAQTININGPAGSGQFGKTVTVLTNGNYVVTDPSYDEGAIANVGAVYLYNGSTHTIISTLKGSHSGDSIGSAAIVPLSNGNFVICSPYWHNGELSIAGAVTWGNGVTGIPGIVGSNNSLVGSTANDYLGWEGTVTTLDNGNYVVCSNVWDNGAVINVGAVTWGNGIIGVSGFINSNNSLVGSTTNDKAGSGGVTVLSNNNYVVKSPQWNDGLATSAGAATWGSGITGISGVIGINNSLIGSSVNDDVGKGITALYNGNYVVYSADWDNGKGAATWGSGATGITGTINSSNSLIGGIGVGYGGVKALNNGNYLVIGQNTVSWGNGFTGVSGIVNGGNSLVGVGSGNVLNVTVLSNGNYVVISPYWGNGTETAVGAVTWGNGTTGTFGSVSSSNSLVGSETDDNVGLGGVTALSNGNYVVSSYNYGNGISNNNIGAATLGNGTTGTIGTINSLNSLVGFLADDHVSNGGIYALSNGNYVVVSQFLKTGGAFWAGAATWGNGTTGITGYAGSSNSLVGSRVNDRVGSGGVTALTNGNYVVRSPNWGYSADAVGAATWGNGTIGVKGAVSSSNSLVGQSVNDQVGYGGIVALSNGNYVVKSPVWRNSPLYLANVGAITWGNGTTGVAGLITSSNSLVGSTPEDQVGEWGNGILNSLPNSNFVLKIKDWDNGATTNAGAITWGNGTSGVSGTVTSCNSVMGTTASGGFLLNSVYDSIYGYLIVGRPSDNIISVFNPVAMLLANTNDNITVNINGQSPVPLIASTGCRLIVTLTPNGATPVNGTINAKVWIEPSVPTYEADPFVARHYEITPGTNAATSTGRLTLYLTQQEFDDFNNTPTSTLNLPTADGDATGIANLRVGKYPGSSSDGSGLPGTYSGAPVIIDPADADIVWNSSLSRWEISFDVTGFSGFVVQTKATPLPLQWLDLSAALSQNDVVVKWTTTNEINAKNFEVERSTDGRNFTAVGTVRAINNTGDHNYSYTDAGAALLNVSKLYYRIKQIDNNDRYSNSKIILLHVSKDNSITVYPNPVNNIAILSFGNKALLNTAAVLTDMQGKRIKQFMIQNYQQPIDMSELSKGVYILKLADGTGVKLIKN